MSQSAHLYQQSRLLALTVKVREQRRAERRHLAALDAPEPGIAPVGVHALPFYEDDGARRETLASVDEAAITVRSLDDRIIDVVPAFGAISRDDERSFAIEEARQPRRMFSSHVGTVAQADLHEINPDYCALAVKRLRQEVLAFP